MKSIYLDYAAATPVDPLVLKAMQPYFSDNFYNPSATYLAGRAVAKDIEQARSNVAKWLGARPSEIVFTAGGTEANNLAISGVMQQFTGSNILVSAIEHESVLNPTKQYNHSQVKVLPDGIVDQQDLAKKINNKTVLVSIMYANNEIGTIEPIANISKLIAEIQKVRAKTGNTLPLYLHIDACQAPTYLELHVSRLGVDLMTLNGGKIYGPKQSGILYIKTGTKLHPQILGGGQERGLRSGTENVAAILGFSKALDLVQSTKEKEAERLKKLQTLFIELLGKEVPKAVLNGSTSKRLPNNIHITIQGHDNERLMMLLDEQGIICAVGSACSASNEEPSHVLTAIGLSDKQAQSSLRFTMGKNTTETDIKTAVKAIKNCL